MPTLKTVGSLVANILVPIATVVTGYLAYSLKSTVASVDARLRVREATRLETTDDREMRFRIYEAVTKSLESTDARRQQVAQALVLSMLTPEDSLRTGLLEVIGREGTESVKAQAYEALQESRQFSRDVPLIRTGPATNDWKSFNVDVFWCEESGPSAQQGAQRVGAALERESKGRIRVRKLARSINAAPGYRMSGLVIRRDPGEDEPGQDLKKVADAAYGSGGFELTASAQGTPGYLSLFVCQGQSS